MLGVSYTHHLKVTEELLACEMGSGSLRVFATPGMIAAMEKAACEALAPYLKPGQTSVGIAINVEHTAATPLGMEVTIEATVTGKEGRRVDFDLVARDEVGVIGHGTHARFIVDSERFQEKANQKGAVK